MSSLKAQTSYFIGTKLHYGYIIPHSQELERFTDNNPLGFQMELSRLRLSDKAWKTCTCYGRSGLSLAYFDYRDERLGSSTNLIYFVEPYLAWKRKFKLSLRAGIGVSYLTAIYDSLSNPENTFFGSSLSFYLGVGINGNYHISDKYALNFGVMYGHISNGGLRQPNRGMNFPTLSLGLDRTFNFPELKEKPSELYEYDRSIEKYVLANLTRSSTDNDEGQNTNYLVLGVSAGILKPLSRINGINAGIELTYDFSYHQRLQNENADESAWINGIQVGHHFSLGKVYFLQQIGIYAFRPKSIQSNWLYQRYSLWYNLSDNLFAGMSLLSHAQVADHIDVRLGWKW